MTYVVDEFARQRGAEHSGHGTPGLKGAADPNFACAARAFDSMFPHHRFGGGSLAVYLNGVPVVDVWTGWSDRRGNHLWTENTGAMVFSATKGIASTVIHRLVDRGLIDYDTPVADYWPEFGANGKADITVREMMHHRAGLSRLNGVSKAELMDHVTMENRLAAAPATSLRGKPAYHAVTYGWLLSGLARAVTGKGMRQLFRDEVAEPLNTDGIHLGRPPAFAPTRPAQIIHPQRNIQNPAFNWIAPRAAMLQMTFGFGALYFPGMKAVVQGKIPFLDSEIPSANGVATARALARMYGAIANDGIIDGVRYLSPEIASGLSGRLSLTPDRSVIMPMSFHLGYHAIPAPGVLPGFGHVGLGGCTGWAIPDLGLSIGLVHNRLLTPFVASDQMGFIAIAALIRRGAALARSRGYAPVREYGARFYAPESAAG